ncbi:MAG: SprB repeat-containing protein [Spirosomaceae bacterium]|nr:SprB repeat-containing protein [Spirosomataceae bacterium]
MKQLLRVILLCGISLGVFSQNKLYLPPIKYTATGVTVFNQVCYQPNGIQFWVNNSQWTKNVDYTEDFCAFGICKINFQFGKLKPGDTFEVRDACGSISYARTVEDDYVYVEVPNGISYTGNSISPTDESPPYGRLSTPVFVGKCESIAINAHGLHKYSILVGTSSSGTNYTSGRFLINGNPLNSGLVAADFQGASNPPTYSINANGSITYNGGIAFSSNTQFSGRTPFSLEYQHNGVLPFDIQEITLGAIGIRLNSNNQITIKEHTYTGTNETGMGGDFTSANFRITYDGANFKLFINNTLTKTVARSVIYTTSNGTLSNNGLLPYGTGVTWTPSASGNQWVGVIVDGVLSTRQQFTVADDMSIRETVTNVACFGGNTGSISVGIIGGKGGYSYSINNGAFQNSNVFSNLTANTYNLTVRDASGCQTSKSVDITQNPNLQFGVTSKNNANCVGQNDGSVNLSGSGGIGNLQYGINNANYQNSNIFASLGAGTYTFWLKDAAGCTKTVTETIGTNSNLNATASVSATRCYGESSGTISVSASGTTLSEVHYSLDGSNYQGGNTFNNLASGTYTVYVKDNYCTVTIVNQTINQPSDIVVGASPILVSCFGRNDGKINVNPSGGTPNYNFSLDGNTYTTPAAINHQFTGLVAGNYKVWVKDVQGCIKDQILTLNQPAVLSASISSKVDVLCFGQSTGSATVNVVGGNGNNNFKIGTVDYGGSGNLNGLSAGTYTITVTDGKSCQTTTSVEILQSSKILINPNINKTVTCYAGSDGQIIVSATGGAGGYTYSKDGSNYQTSNTFDNLTAGGYRIYVKDLNGCIRDSINNMVSQPTEIIPSITSISHVKCYGGSDGTVSLSATGGVGNYTYSKDGTNFGISAVFGSLITGIYTFTIKDGNSCTKTIGATVNQPTDLVVSLDNTQNVLCFAGKSGIITANSNGGTSPYQYSLNGSTYGAATGGTLRIDTLQIGTYQVWVKDAQGCIKTTNQVSLTQPTIIVPSISSQTQVSCHAGNDGVVTVAATGGTGSYQYSKDGINYQGTPTFNVLTAGSYVFTVRDANACTKTITTTVTQPANPFTITLASKTNLSCYQNNTGVITVNSQGGTSPYETWITNDVQSGTPRTFSNLAANTYTVHGRDAKGCLYDLSGITLTQPTDISIQLLQKKDVDCDFYSRGEALVLATGSNGGFSYTLSGYDNRFNPIVPLTNTTGLFQQLKAGDYTLRATDQVGCPKDFTVTIISKNSTINFDVNKTLPSSCLATDGSISLINLSGGRQPYQFSISGQNSFGGSATFNNLLNGTYIVTVSDSLCSYKKEVDLRVPNSISAGYTISPMSCSRPDANLTIQPISGGNGNYQLSLNGGAFTTNTTFTNLHPNVYSVLVKDSPQSCQTVVGVEIKEQNRADLQFVQRVNILCHGRNTGVIEVRGTNNLAPFGYALNSLNFGGSGLFQNLTAGSYKVYARNSIGCLDSLSATLTQPTLLVNSVAKVDNLCFGDSTAAITMVGSGGVSPYVYSINGNTYQNNGQFNTLKAGAYTAFVKDNHQCITTQNITLIQPSDVVVTPQYIDPVRCWGESNGKVLVLASGGTPSYQYSMDNQNYFNSDLFQGLPVGDYTFYVKDANACVRRNTLRLTQPDPLLLNLVRKTNPLCFESKDGTILVNSTGGNGNNTYILNNSTSQNNDPYFQNLAQGNYFVTVSDRRGCTNQVNNIGLIHPQKLQHQFNFVEPLCYGASNGKITINVGGGTPQYRMLVDGNIYQPTEGTNTFIFNNIPSRSYFFTTIDSNACEDKFSVILTQPSQLKGNIIVEDNKCFGDSTGVLQLFGKGATPPYQYSIVNGYKTSDTTFTGTNYYDKLLARQYLVRFKDNHACRFDTLVTVKQPTQVTFTPLLADSVRCFGESNGKVFIRAQGGTPGYVYGIDKTNYQTSDTLKNLKEGYYTLYVRDKNFCVATQKEYYIPQPQELQLSLVSAQNPLCIGESNGKILLKAAGGNLQYKYTIDNAKTQANPLFENLSQGDYTFKVKDWKGCQDTVTLVKLKWPEALKTFTQITPPVCVGDANGSIKLEIGGGILPYKALLKTDKDAFAPQPNQDKQFNFQALVSGKYALTISDANGCTIQIQATIPVPTALNKINFADLPKEVCKGQEIILNANNPNQMIQWFLNGEPIEKIAFLDKGIVVSKDKQQLTTPLAGLYSVSVKNETGCEVKGEYQLVNNDKALKADFLLPVQVFIGEEVIAMDITKPIPDKVEWTLPVAANLLEENIQRIKFALAEEGKFDIQMTAYLSECITKVIHEIEVFKPEDVDKTDPKLGYDKTKLIEKVIVSPNPNYGKFDVKVDLTRPKPVEISVFRSSTGQVVFNKVYSESLKQHQVSIDLKVRPDIYVLVVKTEESVNQIRFIIID